MIVVLARGATEEQMQAALQTLEAHGVRGDLLRALDRPLIHIVEGPGRLAKHLVGMEFVEGLVPTPGPRVRASGRHFYPYHFINWSSVGLVALGLLVVLAGFFSPGVGGAIDTHTEPSDVPISWYLRAPAAWLGLFPEGSRWLGWLTMLFVGVGFFLLPWLDRGQGNVARGARKVGAFLVLAIWLLFTLGVVS